MDGGRTYGGLLGRGRELPWDVGCWLEIKWAGCWGLVSFIVGFFDVG